MEKKKSATLATLEVLRKYSDKKHRLTPRMIGEMLEKEYDIRNERRTIYSNLNLLREFGYDIPEYNGLNKGYYLAERLFSEKEIGIIEGLLADAESVDGETKERILEKMRFDYSVYQKEEK